MTNDITTYMQNDLVKQRFAEMLGEREAAAYIFSVLLLVANTKSLQDCTPQSIYTSALRAATLRLSVDSGTRQAYLVPFKNRAEGTVNATLIIGYKGLYDMAVRTGRYRYINVGKVYEGEAVEENRISGLMSLTGSKSSNNVIGYIGAFEMVNGYSKTIYKTVGEIDDHARRYSKGYDRPDSFWKTQRVDMEKKTVLRELLNKWGYFDPNDAHMIAEIEEANNDGDIVDGELVNLHAEETERHTVDENMSALGFDEPLFSQNATEEPVSPPAETPAQDDNPAPLSRPYSPLIVKAGLEKKSEKHKDFFPTPAQENLLRYGLELCFAGQPSETVTDKRHTLLGYLTGGITSTKKVSGRMFKAIVEDWLKMAQDEGGEYHIDTIAAREAQAIVTAAMVGEGQQAFV
jgi:recombination protein RecT